MGRRLSSPRGLFTQKVLVMILMVVLVVSCSVLPGNAAEPQDAEDEQEFIGLEEEYSSDGEARDLEFGEEVIDPESEQQGEFPSDAVEPQVLELPSFVYIRKIVTSESQILSAEELESVFAEYEERWMSIDRLKTVIDKINDLYLQKGALTAKAFLPPQTVKDGVIRVELVEGRIGEIRVENNRYTKARYIRNRLGLTKGDIFYLDNLEAKLQLFNLTNDVMVIAELEAGEEYQTTDVIIKTFEPSNFQATIFTDNQGSEDTGGVYRAGLYLAARSLFGYRDPLTLNGVFGQGSMSASLNYQFPLGGKGFYLQAGYGYSWTKTIKAGFDRVDLRSEGTDLHLRFGKINDTFEYARDWFLLAQNWKNEGKLATSTLEKTDLLTVSGGFEHTNRVDDNLRFYSHSLTGGKQDRTTLFPTKSTKKFLKYNSEYQW